MICYFGISWFQRLKENHRKFLDIIRKLHGLFNPRICGFVSSIRQKYVLELPWYKFFLNTLPLVNFSDITIFPAENKSVNACRMLFACLIIGCDNFTLYVFQPLVTFFVSSFPYSYMMSSHAFINLSLLLLLIFCCFYHFFDNSNILQSHFEVRTVSTS